MKSLLKHNITAVIYDDDPLYPVLIIKSDKFIKYYAIDINTGELEEIEL